MDREERKRKFNELAERAKYDPGAMEELAKGIIGLAKHIAMEGGYSQFEDRSSDALLGFLYCVGHYNPNHGSPNFLSFVGRSMNRQIRRKRRRKNYNINPKYGVSHIEDSPLDNLIRQEERERTRQVIFESERLDQRERDILVRVYFLGQSDKVVGESYGLTKERIGQIREESIQVIQKELGLCERYSRRRKQRETHQKVA